MTRQQLQEKFSAKLRDNLRLKYNGAIPSAAIFATHFNLQLKEDALCISQETARRWIRGCCLPDAARQQALATWLGLDLNAALCGMVVSLNSSQPADSDSSRQIEELLASINQRQREALLDLLKLSVTPDLSRLSLANTAK